MDHQKPQTVQRNIVVATALFKLIGILILFDTKSSHALLQVIKKKIIDTIGIIKVEIVLMFILISRIL